jgi:hypothetical protein
MKNFRITEEEVSNILSMHKVLMNEQMSKSVDVNNPEYKVLIDAVKKNCLSGGKEILKDNNGKYYYRKPSIKEPGKEIDFFADMTYKFIDGSKSGKWKCEGLIELNTVQDNSTQSDPKTLNANQLFVLNKLKDLRWSNTPVPTDVEIDNGMFLKMDLSKQDGGGADYKNLTDQDVALAAKYYKYFTDFKNGFFVYKKVSSQTPTDIGKGSRVEITIESCKMAIESLYNNMKSPRSYPLENEDKNNYKNTAKICIEPANKGKFFGRFGLKSKVDELKTRRII